MRILTPDNTGDDLLPFAHDDANFRISVLDHTDARDVDWFFVPAAKIVAHPCVAAILRIGAYSVTVPMVYLILLSGKMTAEMELFEVAALNGGLILATSPPAAPIVIASRRQPRIAPRDRPFKAC